MKTLLRQSGPIQSAVWCEVLRVSIVSMVRQYPILSISFSVACGFVIMHAKHCQKALVPTLVEESTVVLKFQTETPLVSHPSPTICHRFDRPFLSFYNPHPSPSSLD